MATKKKNVKAQNAIRKGIAVGDGYGRGLATGVRRAKTKGGSGRRAKATR